MNTTAWRRGSAWARGLAVVALAAGAWAFSTVATQARAGDVYWSVGVHSPGVAVGVSNAPPVVVRPRPVVVYQEPVYQERVVVYEQRPRVIQREVVVVRGPVVHTGWDYGPRWDDRRYDKKKWKKHHRGHGHGRGDWDD
ncbi:hypothetical protein [Hydrogenophaga sp.]|uniref:hypothetical protein n=1 Tax=Hydrogenophaga sp. TaxID=1904254 RepID=UPI003561C892